MIFEESNKRLNAALLIIGDELLSGQTKDENIYTLAEFCTDLGIDLKEVRIVSDEIDIIISSLNDIRYKYDYIFTTGGIGPTHDDITAKAVAKAFSVKLEINKQAIVLMQQHKNISKLSKGSLRMARIPHKATLIKNNVTGAPGFNIDNVFVMAGVPIIMQDMLKKISPKLKTGKKILSKKIIVGVGESIIAKELGNIQNSYKNVKIGSYPKMGEFSTIILSSDDKIVLEQAAKLVQTMVDRLHVQNNIILPK